MSEWVFHQRGPDAFERLHRVLTRHGYATPLLPPSLLKAVIGGSDGWQITTDPEPGSPYLCKSFWDDCQGPPKLFASLLSRPTPYFLFGQYSGGINTSFTMVVRCADFAVLVNCNRKQSVNQFVAACTEFLGHHWSDEPVRPIQDWVWMTNTGRLHYAVNGSADGPSQGLDYLRQGGWAAITVAEELEAARHGFEDMGTNSQQTIRDIGELGLAVLEPPKVPGPPVQAPVELQRLVTDAAEAAAEKVANFFQPYSHIPLGDELAQFISWRLFSELIRRHPNDVAIYLDWYPGGSQMLSAVRADGSSRISLNHGASLHLWDAHGHRNVGYVWDTAITQGVRPVVEKMGRFLGLATTSGKPPPTTSTSIGPRVIAAVLGLSLLSTKRWAVEAVSVESEPENLRLLELARSHGLDQPTRIGEIQLPLYWGLRDHHHELRGLVNRSGKALRRDGLVIDLLAEYQQRKGDLAGLATQVSGG